MEPPFPSGLRIRVGVDLVAVARIEGLLARTPAARQRLFTDHELAYCSGRRHESEHLAARFAAKEAIFKAIGTGWNDGVRWTDAEVLHDARGRPLARLDGRLAAHAERDGLADIDISLAHTEAMAIAYAVTMWHG